MKYGLLLALAIAMPVNAGTSTWSFSLDGMQGETLNWYSSTPTNPQADQYEYVFDLNYVGAEVMWLGIVLGPYDITSDIDADLRHREGIIDGPAPVEMFNDYIEADGDSDGTIDASANILTEVLGDGYCHFQVSKLNFGTVWVDTGFPFGMQEVDIYRIFLEGQMQMTDIVVECPGDIDGDGSVDVTDVLITIGNWGGSGEGDINGDGTVDVSDILLLVGAWGPC